MQIEILETHGILHIDSSEFLFDLEDLFLIQSRNWRIDKDGYLVCSYYYAGKLQITRFHRLIMKAKKGQFVDHINKNRNDNRKQNLRCCEFSENDRNRGVYSTNKSGVTGVSFDSKRGMWFANISFNHRTYFLGRYKFKDDANRARLKKEIELFGDFAPQKALWNTYNIERRCV